MRALVFVFALFGFAPLIAQTPSETPPQETKVESAQEPLTLIERIAEFQKLRATNAPKAQCVSALANIGRMHTDAAVEALLELRKGLKGGLRESAIYAISLCRAPSSRESLRKLASNKKDDSDRRQAARYLAMGDEEDLLWLRDKRLRAEKNPGIRAFLLYQLLDAKVPKLESACVRMAKDKDPQVAAAGVTGIGQLRIRKGLKTVEKYLGTSNLYLRRASFQALSSFGGKNAFELLIEALGDARNLALRPDITSALLTADEEEELDVLIRDGLRDRDEVVVGAAIQAIAAAAEALPDLCGPALLRMLSNSNPEIRAYAISGLVTAQPEGAIPALVRRLEHPDLRTRTDALWALAQIGDLPPNALEKVLKLTEHERPSLRVQGTLAMQWFEGAAPFQAVVERLNDDLWSVRSAATETLLAMRRTESLWPLIQTLEKEEGRVADEIREALCQLTGEDFGPMLTAWKRWVNDRPAGYELPAAADAQIHLEEIRKIRKEGAGGTSSYHGLSIPRGGVVFILDISGSMNSAFSKSESYYDHFSKALQDTIEHLPGAAKFNIVLFETGVSAWKEELISASLENTREASLHLQNTLPGGATNLYDALSSVLNMKDVQTIFLLTDGAPTAGRYRTEGEILHHISTANRDKRIIINTIAAGSVAADFLADLAAGNGGKTVDLTHLGKDGKKKKD